MGSHEKQGAYVYNVQNSADVYNGVCWREYKFYDGTVLLEYRCVVDILDSYNRNDNSIQHKDGLRLGNDFRKRLRTESNRLYRAI